MVIRRQLKRRQVLAFFYANPEIRGRNIVNFGVGGRDPSYPGGEDPSDHPSD
jgi:hypothetical protein